jgi:hypothetical protein
VSCSVAFVRERGDTLEFSALGDCVALVMRTDGGLLRMVDDTIAHLDRAAEQSRSPATAYRRNRNSMNTAGGYWIFADSPAAADHVRVEQFPARTVAAFVLFSDGVARAATADAVPDDIGVVIAHAKSR